MTKKEIALRNLKLLRVQNACIEAFESDESDVWCSERLAFHMDNVNDDGGKDDAAAAGDEDKKGKVPSVAGILYYIRDGYTFEKEARKAIEKVMEDGYLPYHVVQTRYGFGNTFAVLYVPGDDADEDLLKKEDFDEKYGYELCAYVYNADAPDCSEYGYICVKGAGGGIIRTA